MADDLITSRFKDHAAVMVNPDQPAFFEACITGAARQFAAIQVKAEAAGERLESSDDDGWWGEPDSFLAYLRPYVVRDGVLQIPVKGVLLHDFPYTLGGWATGYDYIWRAFQRGMGDANVRGIALIVDSPGGMVAGCFEMVDKMVAMRGVKPIAGFASESAYSAAYATISVVDPGRLYVTRTGGVGSIGVVTSHVDVSEAMERQGYKVTFIYAGAHKVDGNPYEALPKAVKDRIQKRINELYAIFVSTVALNRGLEEQAVRDTEALTFGAADAVENGLADKIGALDDSLAEYSASLDPSGDEDMTTAASTFTQADIDAAVANANAESATAQTAAVATARAEGATAERERISAILASDEGKARPKAALATALKSGMDLASATAFLGDLDEEKAAAPQGNGAGMTQANFDAAMDGTDNPNINAAEGEEGRDEDAAAVDGVLAMMGKPKRKAA